MKITTDSTPPRGGDYYCGGCDIFFSVPADKTLAVKFCPVCGWDTLIKSQKEFDEYYPLFKYRKTA